MWRWRLIGWVTFVEHRSFLRMDSFWYSTRMSPLMNPRGKGLGFDFELNRICLCGQATGFNPKSALNTGVTIHPSRTKSGWGVFVRKCPEKNFQRVINSSILTSNFLFSLTVKFEGQAKKMKPHTFENVAMAVMLSCQFFHF